MKLRLDRRFLAAAVICSWLGGLAVLGLRHHDESPAYLLATGARSLEPATYFYSVAQNGIPIGSASSSIDTTVYGLTAREIASVRSVFGGDSQSVTAMSTAYLTRAFVMDSFTVSVASGAAPVRLRGKPQPGAGVLLPTLAPVAVMLGAEPTVGSQRGLWIYNPLSRQVERVTLRIAAESLFRVVDSAIYDSTRQVWLASHADTIRAWHIVTPSRLVSAWVDSQGRLVEAEEAGGSKITRTAYEIAMLNEKKRLH